MAHCLVEPEEERLEEDSQGSCWLSRDSPVPCEQKERASFLIGGNTEQTTEGGAGTVTQHIRPKLSQRDEANRPLPSILLSLFLSSESKSQVRERTEGRHLKVLLPRFAFSSPIVLNVKDTELELASEL